jgi:hypothetical protein
VRRLGLLLALPAALLVGTGVAWAAGFTLTSVKLGGSAVTTPVMFPVSVTVANKAGGVAGKPQNGDIITLVFSQQIDEPTLCSGWSNASSTQSINLQWSIVNGGAGNDTLQVTGTSATCSGGFHIGTINLGAAGYDTSTTSIDFPTTTNALTVGATTTTLVATLNGQKNGTAGTVASGVAAVWTPDSALKDRSARSCGANLSASAATVQF